MHVHNFKYNPEFIDHDVLVKMFTLVAFNAPEIIWTLQVNLVDSE